MDDALFVEILDRIVEAMNTDRPADVPEVSKRRSLPGEQLKEPRMAVFLGDEEVGDWRARGDPLARRRLPIAVQCAAPTDDVGELDEIVQPMLKWAANVLGQVRPPPSLRSLVHYFRETETIRRPEYLGLFTMTATVIYQCSYQTRRSDLTAA